MALYIPRSIFHLARLLYVRPETFGPYYVVCIVPRCLIMEYKGSGSKYPEKNNLVIGTEKMAWFRILRIAPTIEATDTQRTEGRRVS